jgi:hypothetical protein
MSAKANRETAESIPNHLLKENCVQQAITVKYLRNVVQLSTMMIFDYD